MNIKLDKSKIKRLMNKIIEIESDNLKTQNYSRSEMSDKIIELIKEEVRKCY
ncbi:MAG: hypothetical protein ACOCV1_04490 [Bacillota bacterium]